MPIFYLSVKMEGNLRNVTWWQQLNIYEKNILILIKYISWYWYAQQCFLDFVSKISTERKTVYLTERKSKHSVILNVFSSRWCANFVLWSSNHFYLRQIVQVIYWCSLPIGYSLNTNVCGLWNITEWLTLTMLQLRELYKRFLGNK